MKNNNFNKYLSILVMAFSIVGVVISLITFMDVNIIDSFIYNLAEHNLLLALFSSFFAALLCSFYIHLFKKILKRKRMDIFLSYAHSSSEKINRIRRILSSTDNFMVHDFDSIMAGQNIQQEIEQMINDSKICIILFDEDYFQSTHCSEELKMMTDSKKAIIPILKSDEYATKLPSELIKLKYLLISDDDSWEINFKQSLLEQYKIIRETRYKREE